MWWRALVLVAFLVIPLGLAAGSTALAERPPAPQVPATPVSLPAPAEAGDQTGDQTGTGAGTRADEDPGSAGEGQSPAAGGSGGAGETPPPRLETRPLPGDDLDEQDDGDDDDGEDDDGEDDDGDDDDG